MYSKNDYRYYLEQRCIESDDFLMHYGVKGMKWKKHLKRLIPGIGGIKDVQNVVDGTRKRMGELVDADNARGVKKTANTNVSKTQTFMVKKTKTAPNMYSTNRKAKYDNDRTNHTITVNAGGHTSVYQHYGQNQKKADIKADKKSRHQFIDQHNPYSYDKDKSLRKNIEDNRKVAKKRKALKARADRKVDNLYKDR